MKNPERLGRFVEIALVLVRFGLPPQGAVGNN